MLSIFGCGTIDDVRDDVVAVKSHLKVHKSDQETVDTSTTTNQINITKRQSSSFNYCSSISCNSKYQPDDEEEVLLPAEVILLSLNKTVPDLLKCISTPLSQITKDNTKKERKAIKEHTKKRTAALEALYNLTKKEHNRVPLLNNTEKWNVVSTLTNALLSSMENNTNETKGSNKQSIDEDRRLICWTLNNLSVPYENKERIALGEHSTQLCQGLTMVIQANEPETYLCCICLMNLSYLSDAIRPITFYVPSSYGAAPYSPTKRSRSETSESIEPRSSEIMYQVLGNKSSLIRVIEQMMITNAPYLCKIQSKQSVQCEAIRWACGFIRNITSTGDGETNNSKEDGSLSDCTGRQGSISNDSIEEICLLLSQTEIPRLVVQFVSDSPRPVIQWSKDSLEDICLGAICNFAQWQPSQESLRKAGALKRLKTIEGLPGIHGYRSRAIRCSLGALPKHC